MTESNVLRPAYRIETQRLVMRCWSPGDALVLREALDLSDGHLRPWIPFMKDEPRTLLQTADWLAGHRARFDLGEYFRYGVFVAGDNTLIGENMLLTRTGPGALEIGYWTGLGFEGRGYARETSCAMIRVAFEIHRVNRVEIHCAPGNAASAAIPERLGFTHEATLKNRALDSEGEIHDLMIWTLFATDYPGSPAVDTVIRAFDNMDQPLL